LGALSIDVSLAVLGIFFGLSGFFFYYFFVEGLASVLISLSKLEGIGFSIYATSG
jgi:hypothetical protein